MSLVMGAQRVHSLCMAGLDWIGWCVCGWLVMIGNGLGCKRLEVDGALARGGRDGKFAYCT
jgi:hypothetical protein